MADPTADVPSHGSFWGYIDAVEAGEKTLRVLNRDDYDPVMTMFERMFDADDVAVVEDDTASGTPLDVVLLEDDEEVALAASDLADVRDSLLLVNSDLYITGTRPLEDVDTPSVVAQLERTTFDVADKSKFLLIEMSRHVESMALDTGSGVLHTGFQELSRVDDERGTLQAYRTLAATDLDVHVYGLPDRTDLPVEDLHVHGHDTDEIGDAWFVVHDGDGIDDRKAALVAMATGPNEYSGFWTFDADTVDDVLAYVETTYC